MSEVRANVATAQPSLTWDGVESYLREDAPTAIGTGPDAAKRAATRIARKLGPLFKIDRRRTRPDQPYLSTIDSSMLFSAMRKHWLPRCQSTFGDMEDLFRIIEEACDEFDAAEDAAHAERQACIKAEDAARRRRRAEEAANEEAAEARSMANARAVKDLAIKIKSTERYARMLIADGTTLPEVAAHIAEVLGTEPAEHLRRRAKSGRQPDYWAGVLRPYLAGASWLDFIDNPPKLEGAMLELRNAFAAAYASGKLTMEHFKDLEPVTAFARSAGISADVAFDLWELYRARRLELFMAALMETLSDPFDFG